MRRDKQRRQRAVGARHGGQKVHALDRSRAAGVRNGVGMLERPGVRRKPNRCDAIEEHTPRSRVAGRANKPTLRPAEVLDIGAE